MDPPTIELGPKADEDLIDAGKEADEDLAMRQGPVVKHLPFEEFYKLWLMHAHMGGKGWAIAVVWLTGQGGAGWE